MLHLHASLNPKQNFHTRDPWDSASAKTRFDVHTKHCTLKLTHSFRCQNRLTCHATSEVYARITEVTLRRPLGMVLAENESDKSVFVEEIVEGGNAEKSGKVNIGDVLVK